MAEYREVTHERLYLKEPRTERMRKMSAARLQFLLSTGWRETERTHFNDYITVRMERTGHAPLLKRMPKIEPPPPRQARRGFGQGPGGGPHPPRQTPAPAAS
jgi:hypothetical protein